MAEVSKAYEPRAAEEKWYARWLADGYFTADPASPKPPFSIVMPPPNITGVLTLGHVLNNTIQDILARRARMQGFEVLWLPGMDHAGIGTQTAVERYLLRTEKKTRHDLGREEFLRRVLSGRINMAESSSSNSSAWAVRATGRGSVIRSMMLMSGLSKTFLSIFTTKV